jgi:hypothetical protein
MFTSPPCPPQASTFRPLLSWRACWGSWDGGATATCWPTCTTGGGWPLPLSHFNGLTVGLRDTADNLRMSPALPVASDPFWHSARPVWRACSVCAGSPPLNGPHRAALSTCCSARSSRRCGSRAGRQWPSRSGKHQRRACVCAFGSRVPSFAVASKIYGDQSFGVPAAAWVLPTLRSSCAAMSATPGSSATLGDMLPSLVCLSCECRYMLNCLLWQACQVSR